MPVRQQFDATRPLCVASTSMGGVGKFQTDIYLHDATCKATRLVNRGVLLARHATKTLPPSTPLRFEPTGANPCKIPLPQAVRDRHKRNDH